MKNVTVQPPVPSPAGSLNIVSPVRVFAEVGGAITVRANGAHQVTSVKIDPKLLDPEDAEMLEDLITAAVNEAMRQIDEMSQAKMNSITGGLGLPL